jgi:restriction system protein
MAKSNLLSQIVKASVKAEQEFRRAQAAQARASSKYAAVMDREEKRAWLEEMQDEAEGMTEELEQQLEDIDGILESTLDHDDFYDLEQLRRHVKHPDFSSPHQVQLEPVKVEPLPSEPIYEEPKWLRILPRSARESATLRASEKFKVKHAKWQKKHTEVKAINKKEAESWDRNEKDRLDSLSKAEEKYKAKCLQNEIEIQKANAELDQVIRGLPLGDPNSVETYIYLVLAESDYPDDLHPDFDLSFDPITRELTLKVRVADPDGIPRVASYRFQKSTGEILEKLQSQKDFKERYQRYVCNVVLRSIHEVLEADRTNVIQSVSASAWVKHFSPGTGKETETVLLNVSTSRSEFGQLDLKRVVALSALEAMGASVSKNMVNLVPASQAKSVKKS